MGLQINADFSQYANWPTVKGATGTVYYKIPGSPFVWTPTIPKTVFENPEPAQQEKSAAEKAFKEANSPLNQAIPMIAGVGGAVAAPAIINKFFPSQLDAAKTQLVQSQLAESAAKTAAQQAATTGTMAVAPSAAANAFTGAAGVPAVPQILSAQASPTAGAFFGPGGSATGVGAELAPQAPTVLGNETLGSVLPYAGAALGAYGLYDLGTRWGAGDRSAKGLGLGAAQGAASGAAVGSVIPGVGTLAGAIVGGLYGAASSAIKTGKSEDQQQRDALRAGLQQVGIANQDWKVKLADGTTFDVGIDGKAKYQNFDGKTTRNAWDVDLTNPLARNSIAALEPFVTQFLGPDASQKQKEQLTGMLSNAVVSNAKSDADVIANMAAALGPQAAAAAAIPRPTPAAIHRTYTRSPGIGLKGERIDDYSQLGKKLAERMNKRGK